MINFFKKVFYIIIFIIVIFSSKKVFAGVCLGVKQDSNFYCKDKSISIDLPSRLNKTYGGNLLRPGYVANTVSGEASAFCLDPGLSRPTVPLKMAREVHNDRVAASQEVNRFDAGTYAMYQLLYNNLIYQSENAGLTADFVNLQRSYFQFALRAWTYENGFQLISGAPYTDMFKKCVYHVTKKESNKYSIGLDSVSECFSSQERLTEIEKYYKAAINADYLWTNPLKINKKSTTFKGEDGKTYYRFEFDTSFTDGTNHFFGYLSKGISFEDFKLDSAEFYLEAFSVNGEYCNTSNCYNYTGGGMINSGDSKKFFVELTQEQYDTFKAKSNDGSVNVTMHYAYQHPLNIENLYISKVDESDQYQRMLIIENEVTYKDDTIGSSISAPSNNCKQYDGEFYDNNGKKVDTLEEFQKACGCSYINVSLLNSSEKEFYNKNCTSKRITIESYGGEINNCDLSKNFDNVLDGRIDNNYDNYILKYFKDIIINGYCNEHCTETINISNLKGKFTTKAGMYFEFDRYPSLVATKDCYVDINYTKWLNDYETSLKILVKAYNDWKGREGANNSLKVSPVNDCEWDCWCSGSSCCGFTKKTYTYNYSYILKQVDGFNIKDGGVQTFYKQTCGTPYNWEVSKYANIFKGLSSHIDSTYRLLNDLKTCNNYNNINNVAFYPFEQDLKFYYEQTLSNGKKVLNSERASGNLGGINDSEYIKKQSLNIDNHNLNSKYPVNYDTFDIDTGGIKQVTIGTFYDKSDNRDIYKTVGYKVDYTPRYKKGVNFYSGYVEDITSVSNQSILDKYIVLGTGYDTLISAKQKQDNKFYYNFTKLGSTDKKLFNHFKNNSTSIKRSCDYEITNEIISDCNGSFCDTGQIDPTMNLVYRMVDPKDIDPNNRLGNTGFKNWDNDKGKTIMAKIEKDASTNSVFSPDNLEYSFDLDSMSIKEIRTNKNADTKYSDFIDYNCNNDGNECEGKFVSDYATKDDSGQLVGHGRTSWKEWTKNESTGKCYIDSEEVPCS